MNFKKIFAILAILALTLTVAVSCGGSCEHKDADKNGICDECGEKIGDPAPIMKTYTVTVKDQYNEPAVGVTVGFDFNANDTVYTVTDENGVASFEVDSSKNAVRVEAFVDTSRFPSAGKSMYKNIDSQELFADGATSVSLSVEKLDAKVVYVKSASGAAIAGVELQVCTVVTCLGETFITDAEGKITVYTADALDYVKVKGAPGEYDGLWNSDTSIYAPLLGDFVVELG